MAWPFGFLAGGTPVPPPLDEGMRMMSDKDAATVLEAAADLLLVNGRCVNALVDDEGRHCVVGALIAAGGTTAIGYFAAHAALTDASTAKGYSAASRWNNDPATTDDEVRDTLLLVAKQLRGEAKP